MALFKPTLELLYGSSERVPLHYSILAAMLTGGFAISIANPADTIKVKLMN
jgi:hypothetical protein